MFDAWSLLLSWGALQGLLIAVALLAGRDGNRRSTVPLAALIVSFSALLVEMLLIRNGYFFHAPGGPIVPLLSPLTFLLGPLYLLHARALPGRRLSVEDLPHALPALVVLANLLPTYRQVVRLGFPGGPTALTGETHVVVVSGYVELALFMLSIVVYVTLARRHMAAYERSVEAQTSLSTAVYTEWLGRLALALSLIAVLTAVTLALVVIGGRHLPGFELAMALAFSLVVHGTGVLMIRHPRVFSTTEPHRAPGGGEIEPDGAAASTGEVVGPGEVAGPGAVATDAAGGGSGGPRYERSRLGAETLQLLAERLEGHMTASRPYLDPELSRSDLARQVGVTPHQLSQLLNEGIATSFFDFVNGYRVEEVQRRMLDPESRHLTTLALALESGFASKSSFNRVFKKLTGLTPTVWQREHVGHAISEKASHPSG